MKRIVYWLLPRKKKLFEMLAEQSENIVKASIELKNLIADYHKFERGERKARVQLIKKFEEKAYELKRSIANKSNKSLSTSIDKEDLSKINSLLEETADLIGTIANLLIILSIERIDDYTIKLLEIMNSAIEELDKNIANLGKKKDMKEHFEKIFKLNKEANDIYNEALSELFHYHKNPIDIMKYREIYGLLKGIIVNCKDVAELIENAVDKRS